MNDKVDFSPADKYQRFLQIGTVILGVSGLAGPNNPKQQVLFLCNILKKK